MDKIIIYVPDWAPSVNQAYPVVRGRKVLAKCQRDFRALVNKQITGKIPDDWKFVEVTVLLIPPDRRWFDVDNRLKPTLDALTASGFWRDDSQVAKATILPVEPNRDGGCIIVVKKTQRKYYSLRQLFPSLLNALTMGHLKGDGVY